MDAKLLQRVMDLAERTGDRVIVVNPESGTAHAIMPLDAYEELVDGRASLRDLDVDGLADKEGNENEIADLDDLMNGVMVADEPKSEPKSIRAAVEEEIGKVIQQDLDIIKMAEDSEKEAGGVTSLDVLDDEADEEQYYLEPIE